MSHDQLIILWFLLVAVLWIGFFFLEGFDFGVAMLYPVIGKDPTERRVMINTIGPTWDGNEVWLLTAGGAMFAAFPGWYSTLFSGLYVPLLLVLLGLIVRGVSFEYRALMPDDNWRDTFDTCSTVGSLIVPLVFGIGFANMWKGIPVDGQPPLMSGGFWSLFSPFALLGGVVLVVLFLFHGANFLTLKTSGIVHDRAKAFSVKIGLGAIVGGAIYLVWANLAYGIGLVGWLLTVVAAVGLIASWFAMSKGRDGWAFTSTTVAILAVAVWIFVRMWPTLGFINSGVGLPLDRVTAASTELTLTIMTGAAIVFVPIVLAYQGWSVWVFRKRLSTKNIPDDVVTAA